MCNFSVGSFEDNLLDLFLMKYNLDYLTHGKVILTHRTEHGAPVT